MQADIQKLNVLRLELDLSLQQVADAMKAIGYPVTMRGLHRLVTEPGMRPTQRTIFKVRKYLAHVKSAAMGTAA